MGSGKAILFFVSKYDPETPGVDDEALEYLRKAGTRAVPGLREALRDGSDESVRRALHLIQDLGDWVFDPDDHALLKVLAPLAPDVFAVARDRFSATEDGSAELNTLIEVVQVLSSFDEPALQYLLPFLTDERKPVRRRVVRALRDTIDSAAMGCAARVAVSPLVASLKDPESGIRADAAAALGNIGLAAEPAVNDLGALLDDVDEDVRFQTAFALSRITTDVRGAVSVLVEALDRKQGSRTRREALECLSRLGPVAGPAADRLARLLESGNQEDTEIRRDAAVALGNFGRATDAGVAALIRARNDIEGDVRWAACRGLARRLGTEAVPLLRQVLKESPSSAVGILAGMGPEARREALPALRESLVSPAIHRRVGAEWWLWEIERSPAAVDVLIDAFTTDEGPNFGIAHNLARMGEAASAAVSLLIDRTRRASGDPGFQGQYALALGNLGPCAAAALPLLRQLMHKADDELRLIAASAVVKVAGEDPPASRILIDHLSHDSVWEASRVASHLSELGPAVADAVVPLERALQSQDEESRGLSAEALGKIGPAARSAVPLLRAAFGDECGEVRVSAAASVVKLTGEDPRALGVIVDALDSDCESDRFSAVFALRELGPAARSAIPALEAAESKNLGRLRRAIGAAKRVLRGEPEGI